MTGVLIALAVLHILHVLVGVALFWDVFLKNRERGALYGLPWWRSSLVFAVTVLFWAPLGLCLLFYDAFRDAR